MKKLISMLLTLMMMTMLFAACGSDGGSNESTSTENASTDESADAGETAAPTTEGKTYKVAMICDSSISDGGWGAACYNAMVAAAAETGFETQYTDMLENADFAQTIRSYASMGFDMIFAPGNQYTDAVIEVSAEFPDVKFALLNGTVESDNVTSILPDAEQIGLLAGSLAGLMTETNSIGFIGGMELDTTKTKLAFYEKGAKAINPEITVNSAYAGGFGESAKGKEIAESMVTLNDVDVMFGDASAVDSGAREALANYDDRFDVAQPSDLLANQESTVVINSVVTDNAKMIKLCMEDLMNGTYGNKTIYANLENGGLSIGTYGEFVSDDIKTQYEEIVEQIKEGTFAQE